MFGAEPAIKQRLQNLETHLREENPVLLNVVSGFRELDRVAYQMGLLERDQSYAALISWWPLISVLGTFSSGKSTFINHYLNFPLQSTGNQAVDDKFTVICHSREKTSHVLPGLALDADPRFPFYQISDEIDKVASGEGRRIDSYLQLKTCPSENLRGKIVIDSPGFDADEQRTSILRITEHIINLSDLVLVFFDARHPEPGAMQDTLEHLVAKSINRTDANKFLYVLNQIDTTAREDNPEEVFGAWQRSLAQKGLTAGRFFTIYNPDVAMPIEDERLRTRYETKRDADLNDIYERIQQVEIERSYRIVGALEKAARTIEKRYVPLLSEAIARWRRRILYIDAAVFGIIGMLALFLESQFGTWEGLLPDAPWFLDFTGHPYIALLTLTGFTVAAVYLHYRVRRFAVSSVAKWLDGQSEEAAERRGLRNAFIRSTVFWRSLILQEPAGWGRRTRNRLHRIAGQTDGFVQELNDTFTNPSGKGLGTPGIHTDNEEPALSSGIMTVTGKHEE